MIRLLSIVLPVYGEEANLRDMYERLAAILDANGINFELVIVDDASTDNSFGVARQLCERDPRVKLLRLSRRFGHQTSLSAGIDHARGDAVITMDSDLQHPPELIPELLKKHEEGYEIVYTIRSGTEREGYLRRLCGSLFYHSFRRLTNVDLKAGTADFRLIGSRATSALRQFRERHLFLRGIIGWIGFRQTSVCYRAGPRVRGRSKYDLRRKVSLAFDALFSFSYFPMRLVAGIGLLFDLLAFLYAAYIVYYRFTRPELVPGWASMMVVILFLAGLLLLTLGVFGEYLGRIYEEVKGRPLYVIESAIGFQETDDSNGKANSACRE